MTSIATHFSLAFLFLFYTTISAQEDTKQLTQTINSFVENTFEKHDLAGVCIAVVKEDQIIYQNAFGYKNLSTQTPLQTQHFFHFASVSKPFVATAIMQLVEQGKIDLEEKVSAYLPYFKMDDDRASSITIKQMLNHTSGIPDVQDYEWEHPKTGIDEAEKYVKALKNRKLDFTPGQGWRYSNRAFDTLGDVIAKVSGLSFEEYMNQKILKPIGMKYSSFYYPETPEKLRTTPHIWDMGVKVSEVYPYNRRHAPSSTLNSSIVEIANWARLNLNKGIVDGIRILEAKSYDVLWTQSTNEDQRAVGLSWFLNEHNGQRLINHSGGDTGYNSYLGLFPDKNMALIIAANYDQTLGQLLSGLLNILTDQPAKIRRPSIGMQFGKILSAEGIEAAKTFYKSSDANDYIKGEYELNRLGYFLMYEKKDLAKAVEVFKYNVELFPDAANPYDSLAEAFMNMGKKELAVKYFEKSLAIDNNNPNAKEQLRKLKQQ